MDSLGNLKKPIGLTTHISCVVSHIVAGLVVVRSRVFDIIISI